MRSTARIAALVMIAGTAISPLAAAAMQPAGRANQQQGAERQGVQRQEELPIRNITLYRSGVGYFERQAVVNGHQEVQLRFNTDQVNDILKSMVVLDLDGGRVTSVGYGSKAPLERRLASFAVNVADNPDLATLLNRLRGAPVRVVTTDGQVNGTVLGVETRPMAAGERTVVQTPFVNLLTDSGIRSLDLTQVASFEILDRELAGELTRALAALSEHRADLIKSVDLSFSGEGERRIVVAYVHEMPMWKTSYRLVLPEGVTGERPRQEPDVLTLQGWAIVENTSDEDWQGVRLSLVAGRPVSFQMDLYEPLFAERPHVPVPTVPGVMPRVYQAAVREMRDARRDMDAMIERGMMAAPSSPAARARGGGGQSPFSGEVEGFQKLTADELLRYSPAAAAQAGEVGEVFQYQLEAPVTIERQRSALLPIITSDIQGRRVSIYNRADGGEHPMRGVQLVNTSGLQLMPGPISVFDGASYAGDAQVGHIAAGDKRLLAYALDLEVQAAVREQTLSNMQSIRIVNGMLEEVLERRSSITYAFNNKDQKRPRLILVEHPLMPGWDLWTPEKPAEETGSLYRFEVEAAPGKTQELQVVHRRVDRNRHAVTDYQLPRLLAFATDGKASQAVVDAVRRAADMQAEINEIKRRITQIDQERSQIHQEQNRIRQNMGAIAQNSDLYRQYVQRLTDQERRLDEIMLEREQLQQSQERKQRELESFLRNLNVQ